MRHLLDMEKTDSKEEIPCLNWTIYNGRRKVRVNFKTDTDKLNIDTYTETICTSRTLRLT